MEETHSAHPLSRVVQTVALGVLAVYTVLAPLFFSQLTQGNIYDFPKWFLTVSVALVMLILWGVYSIFEGKVVIPNKVYFIPLSLFIVLLLVAMPVNKINPVSFFMGKAGYLIAFSVITLAGIVLVKNKAKLLLYSLMLSGFLLSWIQILSFFEILPKIVNLPLVAGKAFTPLGTQLALAAFLGIVVPVSIYFAFKTKEAGQKVLLFVVAGIQTLALTFAVAQILPGQPSAPRVLPFASGWSIAVDQLKTGRTAFFGVGPDKFGITFNRLRPVSLNQSDQWFVRFPASSNEWLTAFTTLGILGFAAFILLAASFARTALANRDQDITSAAAGLGFGITLLIMALIPANFGTLLLLFVLGLIIAGSDHNGSFTLVNNPVVGYIKAGVFTVGAIVLFYLLSRAGMAEVAYGRSLKMLSENKIIETYNEQNKAINYNRNVARYRLSYSNTNIVIANGIAAKQNLTDEEKQQISQLVAQSIREAKATVALDPDNSSSWVNLAQIYRQLINFAQGADQWAIASYIQAIRLDNTNPQLRIELGGLLYALQRYEEAVDQFKQAIVLKPNFANAYYNLSAAYQQTGQYVQAYVAMQNVVKLIDPSTADYDKALNELNELQKKLPQENQQATMAAQPRESELTTPDPVPSPVPAGPVEFPPDQQQELAPDVEPTPTPTSTPEATATPEATPAPEVEE